MPRVAYIAHYHPPKVGQHRTFRLYMWLLRDHKLMRPRGDTDNVCTRCGLYERQTVYCPAALEVVE